MKFKLSKARRQVVTIALAVVLAVSVAAPLTTQAAKGDKGPDWAKYQGPNGLFGYASDKFVISQIGGYYNGTFIPQATYSTQVASAVAARKRAHTYIYSRFSTNAQADAMLDYYLPKVQTPKGSIVALDVEDGNPNTDAVLYALKRVQDAGYTAMLYGYKSFLVSHLDLARIANIYPLWLAEYPDYNVTVEPNYNFFPSFNNVQLFQFTSTYRAGGLDGNVDLTGITDNGYKDGNATKPDTYTPAIDTGTAADNTPKRDIAAGDKVKVNFGASRWATGEGMPSWVRGKTYTVSAVSGNRVLLGGIMSWAKRSDVELLQNQPVSGGTVRDGNWTIHLENGTFTTDRRLSTWYWPGYSATGGHYYAGESVRYYGWVRNGQYIYVAYRAYDGLTHYLAVRDNGAPLGSFR